MYFVQGGVTTACVAVSVRPRSKESHDEVLPDMLVALRFRKASSYAMYV